jgi:hypothetical protein
VRRIAGAGSVPTQPSRTDRDHRAADGDAPPADDRSVIRNVVIHIANEQPLVADLYDMPTASDVSLVCTNVRMLDGKKPIFIDHQNSVFSFPYGTIRFIEILAGAATGLPETPSNDGDAVAAESAGEPETEADLELDEDFLRRIREV